MYLSFRFLENRKFPEHFAKRQSNVRRRKEGIASTRFSPTVTYVFRVSFPFRRWPRLYGDYRLQPQDKGTMIEHRRTPFGLDRARNIAAKIPISTLHCRFSDLRDWLTRTSSHVSPGKVSNEINHAHVGASISVVCVCVRACKEIWTRQKRRNDRYIRKISLVLRAASCVRRMKVHSSNSTIPINAPAFLSVAIRLFVRSRSPHFHVADGESRCVTS